MNKFNLIQKISDSINILKVNTVCLFEDDVDLNQVWDEVHNELMNLNRYFREITGNKIIREYSDDERKRRSENMKKNKMKR